MDGRQAAPEGLGGKRAEDERSRALRERVCALIDGEPVPGQELEDALADVARDPQARRAWLEYQQVGDWLRSSQWHGGFDDARFLERFGQRLAAEPVQLAPAVARASRGSSPGVQRWVAGLGAALAGVVAVALVGLGGLLPQDPMIPQSAQMAMPGPAVVAQVPASAEPSEVPTSASTSASTTAPAVAPLRASALKAALGPTSGAGTWRALLDQQVCMPSLNGHAPARLHVLH